MKIKSILLAAVCMSLAACVPEVKTADTAASVNQEKSKDERLISRYDIQDHFNLSAARVDVRHVVESNGCDFIVASIAARSTGVSVSIIHSSTCKCQKK